MGSVESLWGVVRKGQGVLRLIEPSPAPELVFAGGGGGVPAVGFAVAGVGDAGRSSAMRSRKLRVGHRLALVGERLLAGPGAGIACLSSAWLSGQSSARVSAKLVNRAVDGAEFVAGVLAVQRDGAFVDRLSLAVQGSATAVQLGFSVIGGSRAPVAPGARQQHFPG